MEDFVNFKIAQKLKDLGYNIPFFFFYRTDDDDKFIHHAMVNNPLIYGKNIDDEVVIAPTISQVLKWLREERDIDIVVEPINGNTVFMSGERYMVSIYNMRKRDDKIHRENKDKYVSWEEAALGGIQYVLDNNAKNWNYE